VNRIFRTRNDQDSGQDQLSLVNDNISNKRCCAIVYKSTNDNSDTEYILRGVKSVRCIRRLLVSRVKADGGIHSIISAIKQHAKDCDVFITHISTLQLWKQKNPTYTLRVNMRSKDCAKALVKDF
jgi:hypothetical protein